MEVMLFPETRKIIKKSTYNFSGLKVLNISLLRGRVCWKFIWNSSLATSLFVCRNKWHKWLMWSCTYDLTLIKIRNSLLNFDNYSENNGKRNDISLPTFSRDRGYAQNSRNFCILFLAQHQHAVIKYEQYKN